MSQKLDKGEQDGADCIAADIGWLGDGECQKSCVFGSPCFPG